MENVVQTINSNLNSILNDVINKPTYIRGVIHLLLMLYAAKIAPMPPKVVLNLFDNVYFKLLTFSLILWTAQFSPSTSILIAVAFMITINYSTTGKIWEMMENTNTATQSVSILANAASSPTASNPEIIAPIAQTALSAVTTQAGANAVNALATQAVMPVAGTHDNVTNAVQTAVQAMTPVSTTTPAAQAISSLVASAASSVPANPTEVAAIATVAANGMTTNEGVAAVQELAQLSVVAESATPEKITSATNIAAQSAGCYPLRNYDMSNVHGMKDGMDTFEDYQMFTSTQ